MPAYLILNPIFITPGYGAGLAHKLALLGGHGYGIASASGEVSHPLGFRITRGRKMTVCGDHFNHHGVHTDYDRRPRRAVLSFLVSLPSLSASAEPAAYIRPLLPIIS